MPHEWKLRRDMVAIGRRVHAQGFVAATDGNISARLLNDRMLITPSGSSLGELKPADMVYMDLQRRVLAGSLKPSSELALHIEVYLRRPDVHAVIHAHPPMVNALSFADCDLLRARVIPEVVVAFDTIPTTEYATPSSEEGPAAIRELIIRHDAIVLQRHGSLTVGRDLQDAFHKLEKLEHAARILATAGELGTVRELTADELDGLAVVREKLGYGLSSGDPRSS